MELLFTISNVSLSTHLDNAATNGVVSSELKRAFVDKACPPSDNLTVEILETNRSGKGKIWSIKGNNWKAYTVYKEEDSLNIHRRYTKCDIGYLTGRLREHWMFIKGDLLQMIEMPARFRKNEPLALGTGLNFSLVGITMSGLEAISTMANLGNSINNNNNVEVIVSFGKRYFLRVNPRYSSLHADGGVIRLIWDAYRNGVIHAFLPKSTVIADSTLHFSIVWHEQKGNSTCLYELQNMRFRDREIKHLEIPHIGTTIRDGKKHFTLCAQVFGLEFVEATEIWLEELVQDSELQTWFVEGMNQLATICRLNRHSDLRAALLACM